MSDTFFPQTIDLSASAIQLIRTALTFPKVTLDKTGLKSFDAAGNLVVAINADGTAQFSGTITASGLVLAPGTTSSPPAQNKIQWGTIADIVGTEFGTTDNLLLEAFARIAANTGRIDLEAHDTTGHTSEVEVISGSGNPSQGAQILAVAGSDRGTNSRIVIDDLANSHFLQLVNAQSLQLAAGNAIVHWPGGTNTVVTPGVNTGLPTGQFGVAIAVGTAAYAVFNDANPASMKWQFESAAVVTAGNMTYHWLAVG